MAKQKKYGLNPKNAIVNCISCGRDTTSSDGLCMRCVGNNYNSCEDQKGRNIIKSVHGNAIRNGVLLEDSEESL